MVEVVLVMNIDNHQTKSPSPMPNDGILPLPGRTYTQSPAPLSISWVSSLYM